MAPATHRTLRGRLTLWQACYNGYLNEPRAIHKITVMKSLLSRVEAGILLVRLWMATRDSGVAGALFTVAEVDLASISAPDRMFLKLAEPGHGRPRRECSPLTCKREIEIG